MSVLAHLVSFLWNHQSAHTKLFSKALAHGLSLMARNAFFFTAGGIVHAATTGLPFLLFLLEYGSEALEELFGTMRMHDHSMVMSVAELAQKAGIAVSLTGLLEKHPEWRTKSRRREGHERVSQVTGNIRLTGAEPEDMLPQIWSAGQRRAASILEMYGIVSPKFADSLLASISPPGDVVLTVDEGDEFVDKMLLLTDVAVDEEREALSDMVKQAFSTGAERYMIRVPTPGDGFKLVHSATIVRQVFAAEGSCSKDRLRRVQAQTAVYQKHAYSVSSEKTDGALLVIDDTVAFLCISEDDVVPSLAIGGVEVIFDRGVGDAAPVKVASMPLARMVDGNFTITVRLLHLAPHSAMADKWLLGPAPSNMPYRVTLTLPTSSALSVSPSAFYDDAGEIVRDPKGAQRNFFMEDELQALSETLWPHCPYGDLPIVRSCGALWPYRRGSPKPFFVPAEGAAAGRTAADAKLNDNLTQCACCGKWGPRTCGVLHVSEHILRKMREGTYTKPLCGYCGGDAANCQLSLITKGGSLRVDPKSCHFFHTLRIAVKLKTPGAYNFPVECRCGDPVWRYNLALHATECKGDGVLPLSVPPLDFTGKEAKDVISSAGRDSKGGSWTLQRPVALEFEGGASDEEGVVRLAWIHPEQPGFKVRLHLKGEPLGAPRNLHMEDAWLRSRADTSAKLNRAGEPQEPPMYTWGTVACGGDDEDGLADADDEIDVPLAGFCERLAALAKTEASGESKLRVAAARASYAAEVAQRMREADMGRGGGRSLAAATAAAATLAQGVAEEEEEEGVGNEDGGGKRGRGRG
jgi:hypothetical protein